MAIEVLCHADSSAIIQKPKHDLESIFYVLLCFCLRYNGPYGQRATHSEPMPMDKFYLTSESYDDLAIWKTGILYDYEDRVLNHIPPYFEDLKWCLCHLFDHVFRPHLVNGSDDEVVMSSLFHKSDATHDLMIEVLESTLAQLPDINTVPPCTSGSKRSAELFSFIPYAASDSGFNSPSRTRTHSNNNYQGKRSAQPKPKSGELVTQPNVPSGSVSREGGGSSSSRVLHTSGNRWENDITL